jgi:hypothetical protein
MTAQFSTLIAFAFCFAGATPVVAEDGAMDRRNGAALATLQGLDSTGGLFLPSHADASPGAIAPLSPAARNNGALAIDYLAQVGDVPPAGSAPPRTPIGALALAFVGAARGGGADLYGFTRDPRATTQTPTGLRFADPMLLQSVKASGLTASQFKQFSFGK